MTFKLHQGEFRVQVQFRTSSRCSEHHRYRKSGIRWYANDFVEYDSS